MGNLQHGSSSIAQYSFSQKAKKKMRGKRPEFKSLSQFNSYINIKLQEQLGFLVYQFEICWAGLYSLFLIFSFFFLGEKG